MTRPNRIGAYLDNTAPYLTDGGLETSMVFHEGLDLPSFAAFTLLDSDTGMAALTRYFERYFRLAAEAGTGFVLDTVTWRAGRDWIARMELPASAVKSVNARAVDFAEALRARHETRGLPILLNGVVGPAGDGYVIEEAFFPEAAEESHRPQVAALKAAGADIVSAITMTHAGEAAGIARAAKAEGIPVAISFTVETDGRLPTGQAIPEAIAEVDAETGAAPIYYLVNCAHPDHFEAEIRTGAPWLKRLGGIRANASRLSHAELDAATELDDGDPAEFGALHVPLFRRLPALKVVGGCCGTDHRHVGEVGAKLHVHAA
jgi:S-methylmethionine-dependent homocysteine/selenocysteine methylase